MIRNTVVCPHSPNNNGYIVVAFRKTHQTFSSKRDMIQEALRSWRWDPNCRRLPSSCSRWCRNYQTSSGWQEQETVSCDWANTPALPPYEDANLNKLFRRGSSNMTGKEPKDVIAWVIAFSLVASNIWTKNMDAQRQEAERRFLSPD